MFRFFKDSFKKIYASCTQKLHGLFGRSHIDESAIAELERILIEADTGFKTTQQIIATVKQEHAAGKLNDGAQLHDLLKKQLLAIITKPTCQHVGDIYLLVGINGSGKTTLAAKLAYQEKVLHKKVLLVAADTFRAAAQEQLAAWAQKAGVDIEAGKPNQDPASVVFSGCARFKTGGYQTLIIDTAGRLQTKINLMKELEKIKRVITQQLPDRTVQTILTVDSMLGQNSLEQARIFHECTKIDSIALTKMDGTGKGGIVFAIAQELSLPVSYVTFGEGIDQIKSFDPREYVNDILNQQG